jgi:hypothetical protein
MEKLPPMGEDAFAQGFLSKKFGQRIIDRANRPWKVVMPQNSGSGKVMESEENIVLDLSLAKMGASGVSNGNRLHPWQCYITSNAPDNVKLKINEYSCLMKGQSGHGNFSDLTWEDRISVIDYLKEFTHTTAGKVIYIEICFSDEGRILYGVDQPIVVSGDVWSGYPDYQSYSPTPISTGGNFFRWRQLLAFWEPTTGDMIADAKFGGDDYTLRCPTTTHIKEAVERGYFNGDADDIKDYACIRPWFGCKFGSG